MKMARTDRLLGGTVAGLTLMFGMQLLAAHASGSDRGDRVWIADWADNPESLDEAVEMADEVVLGRVTRVRQGPDIVVSISGEPGGEDRIPTEIVTLQVENRYKSNRGGGAETIEVFRTGATKGSPPSADESRPPGPPPPGVERPRTTAKLSDRTVQLTGDPRYVRGQRYVLMLKPGPEMRVDGQQVRLQRPVSPEGRYLVDRGNRIVPVSERAEFAQRQRGRSLEVFEREIRGRP